MLDLAVQLWAQLGQAWGSGGLSIQLDLSSSLCSESGLSKEADDECVCTCACVCFGKKSRGFFSLPDIINNSRPYVVTLSGVGRHQQKWERRL